MELDYTRMINELLNERRLHAFERDDLRFYQEKSARGSLTAVDKAVVLRISRRLNGAAQAGADETAAAQSAQPCEHAAELEELQQQLSASRSKEEQASSERDAAETRVFQLEVRVRGLLAREQELMDQLAELRSWSDRLNLNAPEGDKFKRARAEFARLYHPDNIQADGIERLVRTEIFKEFWTVLKELERG